VAVLHLRRDVVRLVLADGAGQGDPVEQFAADIVLSNRNDPPLAVAEALKSYERTSSEARVSADFQQIRSSSELLVVLICRLGRQAVAETRKLAAILVSDVVGYSRLAGTDEDRTLARLRALRSDLIDPTIAVYNGRVVKRTGDGIIVEFRSVVDAVRCAIEVQNGMVERNAGLPPERRIVFRVGIHLGDVVEESDGDLMGDGVNIAARLEGIAKPGAICLSEDAYRQVKSRLDLVVSDLGAAQLKNIAEPVRVYSLEVGKPAQARPVTEAKPPEPKKRSALAPLAAAIVVLLVVIAGGAWYFLGANRSATVASNAPLPRTEAAHLSIVVLPFTSLSSDPSQDYFADGITENLTTDLSRIRNSFVIARNTAFTFKGKNSDAKEIGKQLGVRYVLEGSVQREQNKVRVNAQLIDAESGAHLWADRFEEDMANLFKLQDQIVARLANTLRYELVKAEAEKDVQSQNPDAIDLAMRGKALLWPPFTKDKTDAAHSLFE
jgi:adenylate cyclase